MTTYGSKFVPPSRMVLEISKKNHGPLRYYFSFNVFINIKISWQIWQGYSRRRVVADLPHFTFLHPRTTSEINISSKLSRISLWVLKVYIFHPAVPNAIVTQQAAFLFGLRISGGATRGNGRFIYYSLSRDNNIFSGRFMAETVFDSLKYKSCGVSLRLNEVL